MERCPNCGAATRPGAKFCTTCGYRLTGAPETFATGATGDAASPGDPSSGDAADRGDNPWAAPIAVAPAAPEPPTPGGPLPEADAAADDGPIPAATDEPVAASAVASGDLVAEPGDPPVADAGGAVDTTEATEAADQVLSSSWPVAPPSSWSAGWGTPQEPPADDAPREATEAQATPPTGDKAGEALSPWPAAVAANDTPLPWSAASTDAQPEPEPEPDAPTDPLAFAPDAGATLPAASPLGDEPSAFDDGATGFAVDDGPVLAFPPEDAPLPPGPGKDPAVRAAALVEELRALLPALTAAPPVDLEAVAADLAAALPTDAAAAASDREILRDALRAAADRPRDIDPMLALTARAAALLALLDAHDALLTAVARSVAALRPDPA